MTFRPNPKPAAKAKSPRAMKTTSAKTRAKKAPETARLKMIPHSPLKVGDKLTGVIEGTVTSVRKSVLVSGTKGEMIKAMLSTPGGATSKELEAATGWQSHSVRGFLGTLRKSGVNVTSTKLPREPTIYHIEAADAAGEVL